MTIFAAVDSFGYRLFFLLHILTVIVAFSSAFVVPVLQSRFKSAGGAVPDDVLDAVAKSALQIHGPALVLAGLFGLGLVGLSDEVWKFDQTWVSIALLLWFLMLGVQFALLAPAQRKAGTGDAAAEGRTSMFTGMLHILLLLMLIVMIWKPGGPGS